MKANELMVGDHIYVKRGYDGHLTVESIKGILQDEKEAYPIKITTGETISFKDIIPMPLTQEILEKNGFTYIIVLGEVAPKLENFELDNHWEGDGYSWNGIPLLYVHELQHALRLCGIEKEIIL